MESWIKNNADAPKDSKVKSGSSLGGFSAKQITFSKDGEKFIATLAVDNNILYYVQSPTDTGFWDDLHNLIVSSFVVGGKPSPVDNSGSTEGNTFYEEEEVVE